jgi:sugar-specific transcriptional regulator TrmB
MSKIPEALDRSLTMLGLDEHQKRLFWLLFIHGALSIQEIAKSLAIPRSSVYLIIPGLMEQALIHKVPFGKRSKYEALSREELKENLDRHLDEVQQSILQIATLDAGSESREEARVTFYEGMEGVKLVYEESLQEKWIRVIAICTNWFQPFEEFGTSYLKRVIRHEIKTQELIAPYDDAQPYIDKYSTPRNQIRILPRTKPTKVDQMICQDKVYFISMAHSWSATVIHDREVAQQQRILFDLLWEQTGKRES